MVHAWGEWTTIKVERLTSVRAQTILEKDQSGSKRLGCYVGLQEFSKCQTRYDNLVNYKAQAIDLKWLLDIPMRHCQGTVQ